jgi:hypothetical protein
MGQLLKWGSMNSSIVGGLIVSSVGGETPARKGATERRFYVVLPSLQTGVHQNRTRIKRMFTLKVHDFGTRGCLAAA